MNSYKNITIFENRRRKAVLEKFQSQIVEYFRNVEHSWMADAAIENERAQELRVELNRLMQDARASTRSAGINTTAMFLPAPAVGGYRHNFDFFTDVFRLREFGTTEEHLLDQINRAIGLYESDKSRSKIRTFNPFWWIGRALSWTASVPFKILNASGFQTKGIEDSLAGSLIRLTVYFAQAAAAFVVVYQFVKSGD